MQKRLLLAGGLTAVVAALAFLPSDFFRLKPSSPLSTYLVPLLRIQALLTESKEYIEVADWEQVRLVVDRIKNQPNNARANLSTAISYIDDTGAREQARQLATDLMENIEAMDYNKYFEDRSRPGTQGGAAQQRFVEFSSQAVAAASSRLDALLALMPRDELEAAKREIASTFG